MGEVLPRSLSALSLLVFLIFGAASQAICVVAHVDPSKSIESLVPSSLAVPEGNEVQQLLFAVGVQFYTYNGTAWVNTNVSADLFNFKGIKVGHHFFLGELDQNGGRATWESFHPVSRVTARPIATVAQEGAIPWLLLSATSTSGSPKVFGLTTFVQRVYTHQGLPPAADLPAQLGDVFESSYHVVYIYSAKKTDAP